MCLLCCGPFLTSFSSGQHLNSEFLPANSLQRVPVLKDGDFILSERYSTSHLTCRPPAHWPPARPLRTPQTLWAPRTQVQKGAMGATGLEWA